MADQQAQQQAQLQAQAQAHSRAPAQAQQQGPVAPDVQFVNVLGTLGEQVAGLSTIVGAQGMAKIIPSFDCDSKNFKDWIKSIEKYCVLTCVPPDQVKMIAYQSSKGPVSDFLKCHLETNPGQDWVQIRTKLTARYT